MNKFSSTLYKTNILLPLLAVEISAPFMLVNRVSFPRG
jgi:hypothetical protein